ncbi:hypothetical protein QB607_003036 [Clostridium botulinum]|nr:hypothetical protein [Clostridium botulinum]EKS4395710.1 hypothetical protein [Clostridium botulinum]
MYISKSKRILIDVTLDKITKCRKQLDCYERYMTEDSFNSSKEATELYNEIKELCGHIYYL